jgi:hypothetical protein
VSATVATVNAVTTIACCRYYSSTVWSAYLMLNNARYDRYDQFRTANYWLKAANQRLRARSLRTVMQCKQLLLVTPTAVVHAMIVYMQLPLCRSHLLQIDYHFTRHKGSNNYLTTTVCTSMCTISKRCYATQLHTH